jgi:NTP pyrophosphatase (non-canonical NTP hydrolase)
MANSMTIQQLQAEVKELLDSKGFAYGQDTFYEKASLAHTEISELVDVIKKQGYTAQEDIEAEVADIIIRTVNFALMFDFDLELAIRKKMAKNWKRPYRYNTISEEK